MGLHFQADDADFKTGRSIAPVRTTRERLQSPTMQIVEAVADARVLDADGHAAYALRAGVRYLLYDHEAGHGLRDGAVKLVAGLDRTLPAYNGQPLRHESLLLPFIGRQGDAIVAASCLSALKDRYPEITVDISAPDAARDVLQLMPRLGGLETYPLEASRLGEYDYYLSFEEVEAVPRGTSRSCADVFSACLRTPQPSDPPRVTVPCDVRKRWELPDTNRPRVAVHIGRRGNLRSYPPDLIGDLIRRLADAGFDVYLIGTSDAAKSVPKALANDIHSLVGKTASAADLAAVLGQMLALVTGDSFPMHLAGALGVPTIALFTATDSVFGSDYPSVVPIQSRASCSPCRIADGTCPLGHRECIAHREPSLHPRSIAERLCSIVNVSGAV